MYNIWMTVFVAFIRYDADVFIILEYYNISGLPFGNLIYIQC